MHLLLSILFACADDPVPDPAAYAHALAAVDAAPAAAAELCGTLRAPALRGDCLTAGAEKLARQDPDAAAALCAKLPIGLHRDECGFQVAERSRDAARCVQAGRFEEDCRMHVWTRVLAASVPRHAAVDEAERVAASLAHAAGFGLDDPRPWIAFARHLLGSEMPLDRGRCQGLGDPMRRRVCRDATRDLFHDRLNHARDTRTFPCDGSPMPERLSHTGDAELEAILAERVAGDLCP